MAVGRDLMIDKPLPDGPLRVWMLNSEEDQDELDRRISAVCQRYEITEADLGGRLYAQSVRDKQMRIAAMVGGVPRLDANVVQQMTAFAKENRIDVVMADPLVSFHSVPENDNGAMDIVIKGGFGSIANQANAAVELFHHPGKRRAPDARSYRQRQGQYGAARQGRMDVSQNRNSTQWRQSRPLR
jgi:RecA-family ATPase